MDSAGLDRLFLNSDIMVTIGKTALVFDTLKIYGILIRVPASPYVL